MLAGFSSEQLVRRPKVGYRGKRTFDLVIAVLALVMLSPIMAVGAIAVRITMGKPVVYKQVRPGIDGKPFVIYKFRTMTNEVDELGVLLPAKDRLTRVGTILRKLSIDELPELWNVCKGDMSIVGPRPLLMDYLGRYTQEQYRRHEAKPGITGLAQIRGRQDIPFSRRVEMDVWYVDNQSLGLDIRILIITAFNTLTMAGVRPGQDVRAVDDLGLKEHGKND
jgi:sugar transferase EpsL